MRKLLTATIIVLTGSISMTAPANAAQPVPKVWTIGPVDGGVRYYKARPSWIMMSVDGNGELSDINWLAWTPTHAIGDGLEDVVNFNCGTQHDQRCWPWDDDGAGVAGEGKELTVTIRLTSPIETAHGLVFTIIRISGSAGYTTLPPATWTYHK